MDIYETCPVYEGEQIILRQTRYSDAEALLACYCDEKAAVLFNSDNCHGDTFLYTTLDRMQQAILFWQESYDRKEFVRWSVVEKESERLIGTVEMFHRKADDVFDDYGILRIDLGSAYETVPILTDALRIAQAHFPQTFGVQRMLTKAISAAIHRREALLQNGWKPLGEKFMAFDDYFVK